MGHQLTALERAFELARSGEYDGPGDIREQLKRERFSVSQLEGPSLRRQLRELCIASQQVG